MAIVDIDGLREALRQQPFEPFTIRLADGRSLPVLHPEFVAVGKRRAVVIGEDDSWSWIEPLLIVSLDSLPTRKGGQSGKGRGKK
jgi:hypothetical protein